MHNCTNLALRQVSVWAQVDLILKILALQHCVYLSMVQKLQPTLSTLCQTASDSSELLRLAIRKDGTASLSAAASASVLPSSTKLEVGVSSGRASSTLQVIWRREPR